MMVGVCEACHRWSRKICDRLCPACVEAVRRVRESDDRLRSQLSTCQEELARVKGENNRLREAVDAAYIEDMKFTDQTEALRAAEAQRAKLRELLRKVEWGYCLPYPEGAVFECFFCENMEIQGHSPTCELAKALEWVE